MTTEIIFPGRVPGMNGPDGIIRMRHRDRKALKNGYYYQIRSATTNQHPGKVRLELVRHSIGTPMDYDNLVSTGKLIMDCMKLARVIIDDKPAIIAERDYSQTKAINQASQFTLIRIIDL
jgi:hypothetical protein